jgi:hypothetical protein
MVENLDSEEERKIIQRVNTKRHKGRNNERVRGNRERNKEVERQKEK